ncbi:MAG: DUF433 domain-containing protein [Candidatus Nanohaloarchaea archaeon]|nr:DUF433 domain-containing protein [Candidatus Nanohaloarchaea archaeon]
MSPAVKEKFKVVKNPEVMGGSARIEGTRVRVMDIVEKYEILDYSPAEIAEVFEVSVGEVFQALAYYESHRDEIKSEIRKHEELVKRHKEAA